MLYFDNAASAPLLDCARDAFLSAPMGNPESLHSAGRAARDALESARATIARCINAEPDEIYFTSGATEANNIALHALHRLCMDVEVSPYEHQSMACKADDCGGLLYLTGISHMLANNETGEIFTVPEHDSDTLLLCDAAAAVGHIPVDVKALGVDMLTAGGHKFGAPQGIGFLYYKNGIVKRPLMAGGQQENGLRPGTPAVPLACAMAAALQYKTAQLTDMASTIKKRDYIIQKCLDLCGKVNADWTKGAEKCLPTVISVTFHKLNAQTLLALLDALGVCCSSGSACHAGDDEPSPSLLASGLSKQDARSTIRISLTEETEWPECYALVDALKQAMEKLRSIYTNV